jgi:hypothetical protein
MLRHFSLQNIGLAKPTLKRHSMALPQMRLHIPALNLILAKLARNLNLRDDLSCDAGGMPGERLRSTAGTLVELLLYVLDAGLAVDLGAALGLYRLLCQLEADRTCETLFKVHENYILNTIFIYLQSCTNSITRWRWWRRWVVVVLVLIHLTIVGCIIVAFIIT